MPDGKKIVLYEKESDRRLFEITRHQLDQLIEALEEEDEGDHDYYIDAAACDFLDGKVDAEVVGKLRSMLSAAGKASEPVLDPLLGGAAEPASDEEPPPEVESEDEAGLEVLWREE